jgi:hypothetical protein
MSTIFKKGFQACFLKNLLVIVVFQSVSVFDCSLVARVDEGAHLIIYLRNWTYYIPSEIV